MLVVVLGLAGVLGVAVWLVAAFVGAADVGEVGGLDGSFTLFEKSISVGTHIGQDFKPHPIVSAREIS